MLNLWVNTIQPPYIFAHYGSGDPKVIDLDNDDGDDLGAIKQPKNKNNEPVSLNDELSYPC